MSYTIEQLAAAANSRHGVDCPKAPHVGGGYLHGADDDRPYDVDNVLYCGRCHGWIGSMSGTAPSAERAAGPAEAGQPWRCQNMGHKRYLMFHCTECSPVPAEKGCDYCGSIDVNPKCPECQGIER